MAIAVSTGVATDPHTAAATLEPTALLREADVAMYQAKKRGKNRTAHSRRSSDAV